MFQNSKSLSSAAVLALPNASRTGLASRTCDSTERVLSPAWLGASEAHGRIKETCDWAADSSPVSCGLEDCSSAKYASMRFVASVLPAPLSPAKQTTRSTRFALFVGKYLSFKKAVMLRNIELTALWRFSTYSCGSGCHIKHTKRLCNCSPLLDVPTPRLGLHAESNWRDQPCWVQAEGAYARKCQHAIVVVAVVAPVLIADVPYHHFSSKMSYASLATLHLAEATRVTKEGQRHAVAQMILPPA